MPILQRGDSMTDSAVRATGLSRRAFMGAVAAAAPALLIPGTSFATPLGEPPAASSATRALRFIHTHTSERLTVEYFTKGDYLPDALTTVNQFLRDFRTGDVHDIDPGLLDLLHGVAARTETDRPFQVISGYRSPVTNGMLRRRSEGVAAHSLHMEGKAIDIRLADVPLPKLRAAALDAKIGGVGYYAASDFVHVDTGRIRFW
jgi:uncharacterized protein YcbK (DUF882 family)